jgi:hypothetical protein
MKTFIFVFIIMIILSGCMTYQQGLYIIGLHEVERPDDARIRYGESRIINFEEEGITKYGYEDEMVKITWLPLSTQFAFTLENKTDHSIRIIWDEAVYVNENGSSGRVMHAGVRYIDRNNPQPPTIIVKNAKIEDMIVPTDNVYYLSGRYGGWRTKPLFPNRATTQTELNSLSEQYIGNIVKILLPLQIQDTINEYMFSFRVNDFISK